MPATDVCKDFSDFYFRIYTLVLTSGVCSNAHTVILISITFVERRLIVQLEANYIVMLSDDAVNNKSLKLFFFTNVFTCLFVFQVR